MRRASASLITGALASWVISHGSSAPAAIEAAPSPPSTQQTCAPRIVPDNGRLRGALCGTIDADATGGKTAGGSYGDVSYADPGYQDDKKPRYPVDTEKHIRAAWSYIHKQHNRSMYTAGQLAQIKARIVAAWKKTIDSDGPPSAEK